MNHSLDNADDAEKIKRNSEVVQYRRVLLRWSIKVAIMKNTNDFCYEEKSSCVTAKSTPFAVSKDEWDTKEDTGKSMKNALYVLQYAKCTRLAEATSNGEEIKPIALAVIKLHLSEGTSQLVKSVSHLKIPFSEFLKFHNNLLIAFWVDLKACLGLTNTASSSSGKSEAGFWVMFLHGPHSNLCGPYCTVLLYCMMTRIIQIWMVITHFGHYIEENVSFPSIFGLKLHASKIFQKWMKIGPQFPSTFETGTYMNLHQYN